MFVYWILEPIKYFRLVRIEKHSERNRFILSTKKIIFYILKMVHFIGIVILFFIRLVKITTFESYFISFRVGRRMTQLLCYVTSSSVGILTAFSASIWMFMLLRFCTAILLRGLYTTAFVLSELYFYRLSYLHVSLLCIHFIHINYMF